MYSFEISTQKYHSKLCNRDHTLSCYTNYFMKKTLQWNREPCQLQLPHNSKVAPSAPWPPLRLIILNQPFRPATSMPKQLAVKRIILHLTITYKQATSTCFKQSVLNDSDASIASRYPRCICLIFTTNLLLPSPIYIIYYLILRTFPHPYPLILTIIFLIIPPRDIIANLPTHPRMSNLSTSSRPMNVDLGCSGNHRKSRNLLITIQECRRLTLSLFSA